MSRICIVTVCQPADSGSDSVNTGLTALPKACMCSPQRARLQASVGVMLVMRSHLDADERIVTEPREAVGQEAFRYRTQYPEMQTSAYDRLMNKSAALKPFRPFDTAGGLTTDWICTA